MPPRARASIRKPRAPASRVRTAPASIGEVRVHRRTGLLYIHEFVPGAKDDRLGWLRFDTWVWGAWRQFPQKTARESDLVRLDRRAMRLGGKSDGPSFAHLTFT